MCTDAVLVVQNSARKHFALYDQSAKECCADLVLNMTRVGCRRTIEAMQRDIAHYILARGQECEKTAYQNIVQCLVLGVTEDCNGGRIAA